MTRTGRDGPAPSHWTVTVYLTEHRRRADRGRDTWHGQYPEPDCPAPPARARTPAPARVGQADVRGRGGAAGVLGVQDQPGGDRPGLRLPPRRPRHAADLRGAPGSAGGTRPAGPRLPSEGLVARLQRLDPAALRDLPRAGERRLRDPHLRGQPDPQPAADR